MNEASPVRDARVRAPRIVPWAAFTAVFSALLMPLGVTMASGTSPATPQTRPSEEAGAEDKGGSGSRQETVHAATECLRLLKTST
jgi:hypothetical protein